MYCKGHEQEIIEEGPSKGSGPSSRHILRSDFIKYVRDLMRRSKGYELPETFNPLIIRDLFY